MDIRNLLGANLRHHRLVARLSQEAVAGRMGVDRAYISAVERAGLEGLAEGQLVWPGRGAEGHGYDPIFQPDGYDGTFAELSAAEKNRISHRAKAVTALLRKCFT